MKFNYLIISVLLVVCVYASTENSNSETPELYIGPDCWAHNVRYPAGFDDMIYGYKCCPNATALLEDDYGSWSIVNGEWCGVEGVNNEPEDYYKDEPYCFARYLDGSPCCENNDGEILYYDMDGDWGYENGLWCAYHNSTLRWNDRERISETKEEWDKFKVKWDNEYKYNFERFTITPGEDESMLNFAWYSKTESIPTIRLSTKEDMSNYTEFTGINEYHRIYIEDPYYTNKVTVTGINRQSTYYYQRKLNDQWEDPIKFTTHDPDNFKFIFFGDPQIGGSHSHVSLGQRRILGVDDGIRNDAFSWNRTISKSFEFTKEPSLILSAGDQADDDVDELYQEIEYSALFLPELLKTVPLATAVGNHDSYTINYRQHFHVPNPYLTPEYQYTIPGYSYFFKYNNVLVVVLETNYITENDAYEIIPNAVKKYPDTDWRIALFHQDLYSNGYTHSQQYDVLRLRPFLTKLFSEYNFDLVINGHDHIYSASQFVSYDNINDYYKVSFIQRGKPQENPEGTLYITANCSTGSKLYGFEDFPLDYIYYFNQTFSSTFGVLDFQKENGKHRLNITSYDVETFAITDGPYILEKPININSNTTTTTTSSTTTTTTTTTSSTTPTTTTTTTTISNPTEIPSECWSLNLGFPCCEETKNVIEIDDNGKWGIENNNWCGITEKPVDECWSLNLGFPCCEETQNVIEIDDNGKWGIENNNWCGIIENPVDECWSLKKGFPCCETTKAIIYTDEDGNWGTENNNWCGIN